MTKRRTAAEAALLLSFSWSVAGVPSAQSFEVLWHSEARAARRGAPSAGARAEPQPVTARIPVVSG